MVFIVYCCCVCLPVELLVVSIICIMLVCVYLCVHDIFKIYTTSFISIQGNQLFLDGTPLSLLKAKLLYLCFSLDNFCSCMPIGLCAALTYINV